jgi:outer membrane protein
MKQITLTLLLLLGLTAQSQAPAQKQSYSFSLEQAIGHATEHNYSAINATRDIEIAKQKKRETTATGLPQINATVDYANNLAIPLSVVPAQFLNPSAPEGQFAAVAFSPEQTVNAVATLRQLLFDGSYIVALQASKTYLEYYENAKQKSNAEVREMVISAYGNVLLTEESIAILNRNKTTLDKTLSDTRETFKNGLIEEENVEQLQITQASVNSNLNNMTRLRDIAYKNLKIALGISISDDLTLTDKLDDLTTKNLDMVFSTTTFDVSNNIDYKMAQNFEKQRTLEWKLQRSMALPTLSASLNFGYNSFDDDFTFIAGDQKYYNFSTLGVSLNIPIFSSFARSARTQQAKIALEQAKTQLTEAEQKLTLQYESAKSTYDYNVEEYNTAKENLRLAERIEKKQQTKFTEGLSTSFDFAEAQRQLYTAQQSYLQSMIDIINAKASLERVINSK